MPRTPSAVAFLLALVCCCASARGQDAWGNPLIEVRLTRAPSLGIQAKRVAFGLSDGPCSDKLIDLVIQDFVGNKVEVIDRQNVDRMLAEHRLSLSGYVDQRTAAELGKILGPAALIFIKAQRCVTEQKRLYEDRRTYDRRQPVARVYISKTEAFFSGSIQVVDLATARVFAAKSFQANPSRYSESAQGQPEFPSEHELQDAALHQAAGSIYQMFFPWTESKKLLFYDDKDCNLKQAHQYFKAGDYENSLRLSEENLEKCKSTPKVQDKTLGHAQYNVGIGYYVRGDYDKALQHLAEASRLRPGKFVTEAMSLCRQAKAEGAQMQALEERMAVEASQVAAKEEERATQAAANQPKSLTVKDVVAMRQAGLSEELIAARIRKEGRAYDLGLEEMLELKKAGVSESLIKVMLDPSSPWTPPAAPIPVAEAPATTQASAPPVAPSAPKAAPKKK